MNRFSLAAPFGFSRHHWFAVLLLLLFVALSIQYSKKAAAGGSAVVRWQQQLLEGVEQGRDISERYQYPNPPIMAILLYPLAKLPPVAMALTWFYLKVVMVLLVFRWVFQWVAEEGRPFPNWAKLLTVGLSLHPIIGDLQHGNINIFILFLVAAALTAYMRKRDLSAGLLIGLAIACKVTPALFAPYFLWKRSWRCLAGCAAGLVLFLWPGVVPGLILGWQDNQQQLASWYKEMVYPYIVENKVWSEHNNQSLVGLIFRLTTHSPSFSTYVQNVYTPLAYDNVFDLSPAQAKWIVQACQLLFVGLVVWRCRTPLDARRGWRLSAEFAIVVLGMLLFSERTWKHHCVTLVLPFAVLCYYLATEASRTGRSALIAALVVALLLLTMTSTELFKETAKLAEVYGTNVFAYLVLLAALAAILSVKVNRTATVRERSSQRLAHAP